MQTDQVDIFSNFSELSEKEYRNILLSHATGDMPSANLPRYPDAETQSNFVGSSFDKALKEAFIFYDFVKKVCRDNGQPISQNTQFLDFGCGWGRFLRVFGHSIPSDQLHGVDVLESIINICINTGVPGKLQAINALGPLPYENAKFQVAIAYSVFTHLPEQVHLYWKDELARALAPGSIFVLTLEPRRFLKFVGSLKGRRLFGLFQVRKKQLTHPWHKVLAQFTDEIPNYLHQFDRGEFVFLPTGGGDCLPEETYGDAVVPINYIKEHWSDKFEVLNYLDKPSKFWQAILVVRRK